MIPIALDITDLSSELTFSKNESENFINQMIGAIANQFNADWRKEVMNSDLKTTKSTYIKAMYINQVNNKTWEVGLAPSFLPNAIESGASPFDEKDGFFKSSKKKTNKEGKSYFIVPFRVATPDAIATAETFSGQMPIEIYKAIQEKTKSGDSSPLKLSEMGEQFRIPSTRAKTTLFDGTIKEAYTHKSSIHEGIQKSTLPQHGGHVSFRVASETNPDAFIHTGIQARNFMSTTLNEFTEQTMSDLQNNILSNFVEGR